MKPKRMFFMLLLTLLGVVGVKAQSAVYAGNQVNNENSLVSGKSYLVYYVGNGNSGYMKDTGSAYTGKDDNDANERAVYIFTSNGNGTWKVRNSYTGKYWGTPTASANEYIGSDTGGDWALNFQDNGNVAPSCNNHSWNRSGSNIHPWNLGTIVNNQLRIYEVVEEITTISPTASEVYTISHANRGSIIYNPDASTKWVWCSGKSGSFNPANANSQWVFYPTGDENQYYLYNVGAGKFAIPSSTSSTASWLFSDDAVAVTLILQSQDIYKIKTANTNTYVAISNGYTGPIINYNDEGGNFTITKVSGDQSTVVSAAVNKLVIKQQALSAAPTGDGWYAIRVKSHGTYPDEYIYTLETEASHNSINYPLGFYTGVKVCASILDAKYFLKLTKSNYGHYCQMPNGRYIQNSGKPISGVGESSIPISYDATNHFSIKSGNNYWQPNYLSSTYFIGETSTSTATYYDIYPINLTDAGLTAWKVIIEGASDATQLTCTRADVSGLASVYNNGYFFLPSGETPANSEFTLEGMVSCTVDADAKTITAQYDPSIGLKTDNVVVTQGYQTTGQGNENALLLRMDVTSLKNLTNTKLMVSLDETTQQNISSLYVYETTATEFIANIPSTKLVTADAISGTVSLNLGIVSQGLHHYWLCATVKDNATLGDILDAALTSITYTTTEEKTLDVSEIGNPSRQGMKVFAKQNFVFKPTTDNCKYYRIPAMILDKDGNVVVAIDRRYNSDADLGGHKIDVSVVRSTDAGRTWSNQNIVAVGNTSIEARYGYGDAALARTTNGKLICLMAAGQNNFFGTNHNGSTHYNNWVAMLTSDDDGVTWKGTNDNPTQPILLTSNVFGMGTDHSIFVSSGKGLTTADGTVMFTTNIRLPNGTVNCYILKTTDEGESWTLVPEVAYSGTDESKLEQLSDGRLILSVRQIGNRGWNFGGSDGTGWGTQYRTGDISGNACNADIINYGRETNLSRDVLIHSYINSGGRESLQLAISLDGGSSWTDVYNIQPNGSCYSTMQVLSDGTLAILYEDESYSAGNGYAINYVTITKDQVEAWIEELDQAEYDFDANFDKTFIIKNYSTSAGFEYILSPKYNDAGDVKVYRTADINESAEMVILKDNQNEGFYYVYDVKSNYYLKGSANTDEGTEWTFSTTPVTVKLTDNTSNHSNWTRTDGHIFLIQNSQNSMANAYGGAYGNQVKNYSIEDDPGSNWYIYATENSSTSSVYVDPTALYYLKNVNNSNYITSGTDGTNLGYGEKASAGTYALIPVSDNNGKFYIYDTKNHNFLTPEETTSNGGQWTVSSTTPSMITVTNQIQRSKNYSWNPNGIMYSLGTYYANAYGGTGLVKNYYYIDKGSHWYLERVDNSTPAIVEMNGITDNVESLVESGVTAGTTLQYTTKLNALGEASWATQYVPFDLTLPENTSAYYINEVTGNTANLEELSSGIPASTPVVIKNSNGANSVSFPVTMNLSSFDETNLLKGTLVPIDLDLSNESTNYSLGQLNGNIGFYKFKATDGTTSITLGANKAYLQIPVPTSNSVRGFKFAFAADDSLVSEDGGFVDGINEVKTTNDETYYNLNGLRVNTLRKGIYIVNGKKVVVVDNQR